MMSRRKSRAREAEPTLQVLLLWEGDGDEKSASAAKDWSQTGRRCHIGCSAKRSKNTPRAIHDGM
jgi:hypothetical protein